MISSNRRTLMKGGVALAALGAVPSALHAAGRKPAVFIYDARFAASAEMARAWQAQGISILDPRADDLGIAWRRHIPQLLASGGGIEGATLWSDRFVCETFARHHGLSAHATDARLPGTTDGSLRHWVIS